MGEAVQRDGSEGYPGHRGAGQLGTVMKRQQVLAVDAEDVAEAPPPSRVNVTPAHRVAPEQLGEKDGEPSDERRVSTAWETTPTPLEGPAASRRTLGQVRSASTRRHLATANRMMQRRVLAGVWVVSFLWNVLSPVKNWTLSRYEISSTEVAMNFGMNWWDELDFKYVKFLYDRAGLDFKYVKFLYDRAGVPCFLKDGEPTRLVNLYVDFMVLPRATSWAHGISPWHQDALVGRYCQASLVPQRDAQGIALQELLSRANVQLWGKTVRHYIPDQTECHVNEVPEAILCLKGLNATQLLNLEWSTGRDPADPVVYEAMAAWQRLVLPSLDACIERREWLRLQHETLDDALLALARELASNFSLNPYGYAGTKNLIAVYDHRAGFLDVNGRLSGMRKVSLSGSITERNRNNYDGDMNAVTALREAIWCCLLDASIPPSASLKSCLLREGRRLPAIFLGDKLFRSKEELANRFIDDGRRLPAIFLGDKLFRSKEELANRFIDDVTLVQGVPGGSAGRELTEWNYRPTPAEPLPVTYLRAGNMSGVEAAYRDRIDFPLVFEYGRAPVGTPSTASPIVVQYKCIYEPGCAAACHNNTDRTTAMYMVYAVRKSGTCYRERFAPELINRNGFVSRDCYGIGSGTNTMFFKLDPNATATHGWTNAPTFVEIANVADPNAILACIMGGRVPVKGDAPFPSGFHNMVSLGTGMVLTVIFGDGSEQVLFNMYALVSLAGAVMYAGYVLTEATRMFRLQRRAAAQTQRTRAVQQVRFSITVTTLSFRVWRLHFSHLSLFGFFTVFSWILGSSKTLCSWYSDGRRVIELSPGTMDLSVVPEYRCHGGSCVGHFARAAATQTAAYIFYGALPAIFLPMVVIGFNNLRLMSPTLQLLHNQLFVALATGLVITLLKQSLVMYDRVVLARVLALLGQSPQKIERGSTSSAVAAMRQFHGGPSTGNVAVPREKVTSWVPLSALIEFMTAEELECIDFRGRRVRRLEDIEEMGDVKLASHVVKEDPSVPAWVREADEFYICIT
ncbi:hypothetical protein P43SY_007453 [Pythium insidiosum]|uniref:Transmembrane protein n=1 Tax=Pythium insidiosum TaxID=114742 RepID=A0AAD5LF28_PYTIN|nr:hypothetical protein P43SY_007453 [Pythium insidiosum]